MWYHSVELPDGRVLPGAWDLRGHESVYLGGVDVAGKRVLELGPATGYLTFYMERMGAEVVSFEAGFDVSIDLLPVKGVDHPEERLRVMQETIDRNHDALVVPAPHLRFLGHVRPGEHLRHARRSRHLRHHGGGCHPPAPA